MNLSPDEEKSAFTPIEAERHFPARVLPGRYPLLRVLIPLVAGHIAAAGGFSPAPAVLWIVATGCALGALFLSKRPAAWTAIFSAGVFCAGVLHWGIHCPPPPDRDGLPPREATLGVRADEFFATRDDTPSGIGTVVSAPRHLAELTGSRIMFRVTDAGDDPAFDIGAVATLRGVLENAPRGEGFARYLRQRGVALTLSYARRESTDTPATPFRIACTRARKRVASALAEGVSPEDAARISALMLGRTSLLPARERDDFRKAGATHLFAISGLHITGIAGGLLWIARRLRVRDILSIPVTLAILRLYVAMAGDPGSAMRAWIMATALFCAPLLSRPARPASGLILAAVATLLLDPAALREPGFLLSYIVVGAILFYAIPATRELESRLRPWRFVAPDALGLARKTILAIRVPVFSACAATFAASLAGAPLSAALFGNVSCIGMFANLALVPLAAPPVFLGFISSALGALGLGEACGPPNIASAFFLQLLAIGARLTAEVPGGAATIRWDDPRATAFAGVAILGALLLFPVRPDRSPLRYLTLPAVSLAILFFAG